jgi:hypothetical protein
MPDALAPASPRPQVVEDVLGFLCDRVVELQDSLAGDADGDREQQETEMQMSNRLVDLVLYRYHELAPEDIERLESEARP